MDLLTTYTRHSELQVIAALSLISIIQKSPQHPLSLSPACCVLISRSLAMASISGDSSASHAQVLASQPPVQNSTGLTTDRLAAISHQLPGFLFTSWHLTYWTTNWVTPIVFKITPQHKSCRKHPHIHCCCPAIAAV
jgi:hypothetical protein